MHHDRWSASVVKKRGEILGKYERNHCQTRRPEQRYIHPTIPENECGGGCRGGCGVGSWGGCKVVVGLVVGVG